MSAKGTDAQKIYTDAKAENTEIDGKINTEKTAIRQLITDNKLDKAGFTVVGDTATLRRAYE